MALSFPREFNFLASVYQSCRTKNIGNNELGDRWARPSCPRNITSLNRFSPGVISNLIFFFWCINYFKNILGLYQSFFFSRVYSIYFHGVFWKGKKNDARTFPFESNGLARQHTSRYFSPPIQFFILLKYCNVFIPFIF